MAIKNPLTPLFPPHNAGKSQWGQLYSCSRALIIANAASEYKGLIVVITADMQSAYQLESELHFFSPESEIHLFPDWETLPYDQFSPLEDIVSDRLKNLSLLPKTEQGLLIVSASTLMHKLPPTHYITAHTLPIKVGDVLDISLLRNELEIAGYRHVGQVMGHGEYATRGSLIDLFPMGSTSPYRIDLLSDEVESIRIFEPETQRTLKKIQAINLLPAHEYPLTQEAITAFRQRYRAQFTGDISKNLVYLGVSDGLPPSGIEYYLPLFFDEMATLFDYFPAKTLLICDQSIQQSCVLFSTQVNQRYEQYRHDIERPILTPDQLFLTSQEITQQLEKHRIIYLNTLKYTNNDTDTLSHQYNYNTETLPALTIQTRAERPLMLLQQFIATHSGKILFTASSTGRREEFIKLLQDNGYRPKIKKDWAAFVRTTSPLSITTAPIDDGIWLTHEKIAIIPESALLGQQVSHQRKRKKTTRDADAIIRNLTDLAEGAPVVHEEQGVGRYLGMQTIITNEQAAEYLVLEYAKKDKLYVPVTSLHLISRYTGTSEENAPLHKLGSNQWDKAKKQASHKAYDAATELLEIHARRAVQKGESFIIKDDEYKAFSAAFPYQETEDQTAAIDSVVKDMQSPRPMDRVICGDVGFGKTEVAMRAAFIAANAGKQVAIIAPTTLLVQQHYHNFLDRFVDWPFNIDSLSRFKSTKETKEALNKLKTGSTDIVIGTHKLLQKDIAFKQLGLVIIDEEHRFGVRHKEQMKKLRANVDMLTLTATPIPRTLNMSLAGIRDLSIIATPPIARSAVKTFVVQWDNSILQEACARELSRGGQVYVLHNEVKTIQKITTDLQTLMPEATIRFAHGQMQERELESIMDDFYHQRFHILVATTIIESGIDIPTANTIIINRADRLGLAQLHQLRGRVGRSHHRAYAYLITPPKQILTKDALKRLEAIESLEELGIGFTLASHDLEIRGAGELLGEDQSGQIQEIGFSLYHDLLERAVTALKAGKIPDFDKKQQLTTVDLGEASLIPSHYIPDVHSRLILYKRIASADNKALLHDLRIEMIDRFGLLPEQTNNLLASTELKLQAKTLGIVKLDLRPESGRIDFNEKPAIDPLKLIHLLQKQPNTFKMNGQDKLNFFYKKKNLEERIQWIKTLFKTIEK